MAKTLKTYITNLGFFELALAAPSMKAALEAWGMGHNAFHQGFARQTDDPKIVAATMARPGVVLKRPVGSKGAFRENAKLPEDWVLAPPEGELPKPKRTARKPKAAKRDKAADTGHRAAIISFEKEKARREKARAQETARQDAREKKDRARRERDRKQAQAALDRGEARHRKAMAAIEKQRDTLDRRARRERERWDAEREKLNGALARD